MPKSTSFLVSDLADQLREAIEIAEAAENSSTFLYTRRLYVYEAAYLLAFSAWENMLEQSFLRFDRKAELRLRLRLGRGPET
jgi:hypothetical protein